MNKDSELLRLLLEDVRGNVRGSEQRIEAIKDAISGCDASSLMDLPSDAIMELLKHIYGFVLPPTKVEVNLEILEKLLLLQLLFSSLSKDVDDATIDLFKWLYKNSSEVYEEYKSKLLPNEVELKFKFDASRPNSAILHEMEVFSRAVKLITRFTTKALTSADNFSDIMEAGGKGMVPVVVFHKEVIGKEDLWDKEIEDMFLCYKAIKLKEKDNMSLGKIAKELNLPSKDKSNALAKVKRLQAKGKMLAESASCGTFPLLPATGRRV